MVHKPSAEGAKALGLWLLHAGLSRGVAKALAPLLGFARSHLAEGESVMIHCHLAGCFFSPLGGEEGDVFMFPHLGIPKTLLGF